VYSNHNTLPSLLAKRLKSKLTVQIAHCYLTYLPSCSTKNVCMHVTAVCTVFMSVVLLTQYFPHAPVLVQ